MYSLNTPKLETGRLILRRFTGDDLDALFLILSDKDVNTFLPWFPLASLKEARAFFEERYAGVYRLPVGYGYAVCLKSNNVPVGYVNVSTGDSHDLGYGLRKEFWHMGLAAEACRAIIGQVQKDGLPYITATHDRNNPRSGEVMKRLGMRCRYSYEEQWQPKNIPVTFRMYQLNFDGHSDRVFKKYWNDSPVHFIEADV